jgi:BMFP domain-containing protein YqiC
MLPVLPKGARREVETAFRAQAERFLSDMDLVSREEHEAVKEMAVRALDRIDEAGRTTRCTREAGRKGLR